MGYFEDVIAEHLELKERNRKLEHRLPLERYLPDEGGVAAAPPATPDHDSWWDGATTTWESVGAFSWDD
jgi:hypothetical protein